MSLRPGGQIPALDINVGQSRWSTADSESSTLLAAAEGILSGRERGRALSRAACLTAELGTTVEN